MNRILFSVGFVVIAIAGCASKLVVHSADNPGAIRGIRVRAPVSYVVTKEIKTEKCPAKTEESIVHLAVGEAYDVTFESAPFAKSEFSVSFSDTGVLKQVSLNSTPQAAETLKGAG